MASSSCWLSLPIQLLRYAPSSSSNRLGLGSVHRPSPHSAAIHMQPAKGLKPVAVTATGRGDGGVDATCPLHLLADEVAPELHAAKLMIGGALHSPKGRPGSPTEGSGGRIHPTHAAAPTFAKRARGPTAPGLPAEGSGGNGGTKH